MTVTAKFKCVAIEASQYGNNDTVLKTIKMTPVYGNIDDPDNENGRFFKYTPTGSLSLGVLNEEASSQFELGKSYYLEFKPAD